MIIHLNGTAGVGKLTVAKILNNKIKADIIDNHKVLDLVKLCCDRRTPEYFSMIHKTMDLVFDFLALKPKDQIFVFTNWLSDSHPEDRARFQAIANFATKRQVPFVPILLECSLEENKKRVVSESRKTKNTLMDPDILEDILKDSDIHHPDLRYAFKIDTTNNSAEETADEIINYINSIKAGN